MISLHTSNAQDVTIRLADDVGLGTKRTAWEMGAG
ncbi:hypothetical protein J2X34_000892 [Rhodococcus sp. BE178]